MGSVSAAMTTNSEMPRLSVLVAVVVFFLEFFFSCVGEIDRRRA